MPISDFLWNVPIFKENYCPGEHDVSGKRNLCVVSRMLWGNGIYVMRAGGFGETEFM